MSNLTVRLISGLKLLITNSFAVQMNSLINITDCVSGDGVWIVQSISQQDGCASCPASCPALSGRRGRLDGRSQEEVKRTTESWTVELLPTSDLQVAPMSEPQADRLCFFRIMNCGAILQWRWEESPLFKSLYIKSVEDDDLVSCL